jgi:hypothetical protein
VQESLSPVTDPAPMFGEVSFRAKSTDCGGFCIFLVYTDKTRVMQGALNNHTGRQGGSQTKDIETG